MSALRGLSLTEQIVARHAIGTAAAAAVRSGAFASVRPRFVMTHDNTAAVMSKYGCFRVTVGLGLD